MCLSVSPLESARLYRRTMNPIYDVFGRVGKRYGVDRP